MRFKSFKQKEDELKASRTHIENIGQFTNEELYTIDDTKLKKTKNEQVIKGNKHNTVFLPIVIIIIHILAIFGNILNKTPGMVVTLVIGVVFLLVVRKKINIEYDFEYRERLNNFSITLKSVLNYFPFIVAIGEKSSKLHKIYVIATLLLPFIMVWNGLTYFFGFIYFSLIIIWLLTLIIDFYNKEYFKIEKKLAFIMDIVLLNILIFGVSGSAFYVVVIVLYIFYTCIYRFIRTLTDHLKRRVMMYGNH